MTHFERRFSQLRILLISLLITFCTALFVSIYTTVAWAADAAVAAVPAMTTTPQQAWWQALLIPVLGTVGMVIAAFLVAGLGKLTKLIEAKWNIDIPDSVENLMAEKAKWLIAWSEEKAEKRLLYGDGQKTDSAKKLSEVVGALEDFAVKMGYGKDWQQAKLEQLVEGILHIERDKAIGSTGTRNEALVAKLNGNK